jgi:hypothetical protein
MLNTKYIITSDGKSPELSVQKNPAALGHAWFVNKVKIVGGADEEMQAITSFSPQQEVIVDKQFTNQIPADKRPANNAQADSTSTNDRIALLHYSPDTLIYESSSPKGGIAVFSEIYYSKGWKMFVDGVEKPYFRVNYLLRAASLPAGKHKVEFIFHPVSYYAGEKISLAGSALLIILLAGSAYQEIKRRKRANATPA